MAKFVYKQEFSRLYTGGDAGERALGDACAFLPDGRLHIGLGETPDILDFGMSAEARTASRVILSGKAPYQYSVTPDGRYRLEIDSAMQRGVIEFWLVHTDLASGRYRRVKLNTELGALDSGDAPRVSALPGGGMFVVDDSGVIRLYNVPHLLDVGAFQIAHPGTENRVIALAATTDDQLIAGLSSWKNIVLYSVPQRRMIFVRQIQDQIGWYDPEAHILLTHGAELIVTVGAGRARAYGDAEQVYSVNVFRLVPLS